MRDVQQIAQREMCSTMQKGRKHRARLLVRAAFFLVPAIASNSNLIRCGLLKGGRFTLIPVPRASISICKNPLHEITLQHNFTCLAVSAEKLSSKPVVLPLPPRKIAQLLCQLQSLSSCAFKARMDNSD